MKKRVFQILLINSVILLSANAQSASIYNPALTLYPEPPLTTQDSVYAELSGDFATAGFVIDGDPSVTIAGNRINIAFYALAPTGFVAQVIIPFSVNAGIGLLNEGTYDVSAGFYVDNVLEHQLNDSLTVSAIPLPAAVWLFGSGVIAMIGLARREDWSLIRR